MPDLDHYQKILNKNLLEKQKLIGQKEEIMNGIKEHGLTSIKDVEEALNSLASEIDELSNTYEVKVAKFEEEFGRLLT